MPEQDEPGRLGRPAQQALDEQRDEDERRVQDDRRARARPSTAAVNGRLANSRGSTAGRSARELEPDEHDEQRHDRDRPPARPIRRSPPLPRPRIATSRAMSIAASRTRPGDVDAGRPDARPRPAWRPVLGRHDDADDDRGEDRDRDGQHEQRLPAERPDEQRRR